MGKQAHDYYRCSRWLSVPEMSLSKMAMLNDAFYGPYGKRGDKRRPEEELLNFEIGCSSSFPVEDRNDIKRARLAFTTQEAELPYVERDLYGGKYLLNLPALTVPAFGQAEDPAGKFDLIQNRLTPLSGLGPLEPNHLLFQYMGLNRVPYARGEVQAKGDPLKAAVYMEIYDQREEVATEDGVICSLRELQLETRLGRNVQESYDVLLASPRVDPLVILVSYPHLQIFQEQLNKTILAQYAPTMRGETYIRLKERIVEEHGSGSVAALLVHMQSPEMMLDTFYPRGILSSGYTHMEGVVTIQTMGQLNIDIEDGDQHKTSGSTVSSAAVLYLVVEMKSLVEGEAQFNYPAFRMVLSTKTIAQMADAMLLRTKGRCHLTRAGKLSKSVILPVGQVRVGPHHVHGDRSSKDARQYSQLEILLSHVKPTFVTYCKSF